MVSVDPSTVLKCAECKEVFHDSRNLLRNAGVGRDGRRYYNTECPGCGRYDTMNENIVGVPNDIIDKYNNDEISYQEMMEHKDEELAREERADARRP